LIANNDSVIDIHEVEKEFRSGFRKRVRALCGVSFQVGKGEIFGLLGPNGAGKTTIIKVLLGIVRRSGGKASLLGFPAGDRRGRRRVGYLPENLRLPRHQTARTALEFYGRLSGLSRTEIRRKTDPLLEQVGLLGRDRESVGRFSKGMSQRLGLAQALLHEPDVLILDEPTDGLDPVGRNQIRNILQRLKDEGRTVFLNSHLLQEVELVCDRVAILDQGKLRFEGTIAELTPAEFSELELVLVGDEQQARSALGSRDIKEFQKTADDSIQALVMVNDQDDINQLIDDLRLAGIGISHVTIRRKTLEDAFIELVSQDQSSS